MRRDSHKNAGPVGVRVEASPFNGIKLELGVVIIVCTVAALITNRFLENGVGQLLALVTIGLLGSLWLILRTRSLMNKYEPAADHPIQEQNDNSR